MNSLSPRNRWKRKGSHLEKRKSCGSPKPIPSQCVSNAYEPTPRLFRTSFALLCEYDVALASPIAGRYPKAITFLMIHVKLSLSELFSLSRQWWSLFCTSLWGITLDTSYPFWRRFLAVSCPNRFRLTFCSSIEHDSFWNAFPPNQLSWVLLSFFFVMHSCLVWNHPALSMFLYFDHHVSSS